MDKYKAVFDYLKSESRDDFYLSLSEIEGIIGESLPKSAYTPRLLGSLQNACFR